MYDFAINFYHPDTEILAMISKFKPYLISLAVLILIASAVLVPIAIKKYRLTIEGVEMKADKLKVSQWSVGSGYRIHYKANRDVQPFILSVTGDLQLASAYPGFLGSDLSMDEGLLVMPSPANDAALVQGLVGERRYFIVFSESPIAQGEDSTSWIEEKQKELKYHALQEGGKDAGKDIGWHQSVVKSWSRKITNSEEPKVIVYLVED